MAEFCIEQLEFQLSLNRKTFIDLEETETDGRREW